jgi:Cu(I)/Ag(I) efflux system periplasmic protein CusF
MNMRLAMAGIAMFLLVATASAQTGSPQAGAVANPANTASVVEAEVRKVDKNAGKITLRHGPIPNLDMPTMTMVFRVNDTAMLDQVRAGDKVRFTADKVGGQYTIMTLEGAK